MFCAAMFCVTMFVLPLGLISYLCPGELPWRPLK